jgi:CMP-N-acetylneuraminic acid synthetase
LENNSDQKVYAIVPARGGSKGLPRKNIVDLFGKPLIAYTIDAALKAKLIDRVIVTTEDKEIADIAQAYGGEVPFLRPRRYAGDRSKLIDAVNYTIKKLESIEGKIGVYTIMLPTHPFRNPGLIDFLTNQLLSSSRLVRTVRPINHAPEHYMYINSQEQLIPIIKTLHRKRLYQRTFRTYGLFNGVNVSNPRVSGFYLYHLSNPALCIDIDYYEDLVLAREIIKQGLFNFKLETVEAVSDECHLPDIYRR